MQYNSLQLKKILITAGPTLEAIDPVRYVSNHSSGKMAYAIANSFLKKGAEVHLVSGPVYLQPFKHPNLEIINVTTASEMYLACSHYFENIDIAVFAAAVADYRPEKISAQKIKKDESSFTITMTKNVDIAYEFGRIKKSAQLSVGFALETNDEIKNAMGKLTRKNFDMVVLNSMNDANATFGFDTNKISIIKSDFTTLEFQLKAKTEVAADIVSAIEKLLQEKVKGSLLLD